MADVIESTAKNPEIYTSTISEAFFYRIIEEESTRIALELANKIYQSNKPLIRSSLQDRIAKASKIKWNTVATSDSFGLSRSMRVNNSMGIGSKRVATDVRRLRNEVARIDRNLKAGNFGRLKKYGNLEGLTAKEARKKAVASAVKNQTKVTENFLKYHENRLVRTEAKGIWYDNFIAENGTKPALWICGDEPCPECSSYCGEVFKPATSAPMIPVHANCRCRLKVVKS